MGKRRISKRQANRISDRRQEKLQSADTAVSNENLRNGLVISQHGVHVDIEDDAGQHWQLKRRQHLGAIVAGDRVLWEPHEQSGAVVAIQPRQSLLSRPNSRGQLCAVAANVDQLIIVIAPSPSPNLTTIDRYLVAAEINGIEAVILLNKIDLLGHDVDPHPVQKVIESYQPLGYHCHQTSAKDPDAIHKLLPIFANHTSVLVGQSGVGKSSLVQALLPEYEIRTGALSHSKELGTHTTTQAKLYHLSHVDGDLIDSPGIRQFPLWPMTTHELSQGFREFQPFIGQCKFRNCRHQQDPGCRLQQAIHEGDIAASRMASFQQIAEELSSD